MVSHTPCYCEAYRGKELEERCNTRGVSDGTIHQNVTHPLYYFIKGGPFEWVIIPTFLNQTQQL